MIAEDVGYNKDIVFVTKRVHLKAKNKDEQRKSLIQILTFNYHLVYIDYL